MIEYANIVFYNEYTKYKINIEPNNSVYKILSKEALIIETHGDSFCFKTVGFFMCEEKIITVFPKGFYLTENPVNDASILLRVLLRYRNSRNLEPEEKKMLFGDTLFKNGRLVSAIALLDDYKSNGYLRKLYTSSSRKIGGFTDWNRTITTITPLINNKRPIYADPVRRSTFTDIDNILCKIHNSIITECISLLGWLCELDSIDIQVLPMPVTCDEAVSIIKKELRHTYVQREIEVLKLMLQYLSAKSGEQASQSIELLMTPFFHNTWEEICGYLFENQYSILKDIVPRPKWRSSKIKGTLSQRPDILYIHNNNLYILDAKYYDYSVTTPGWHDVVKQLFYRYTIERNIESKEALSNSLPDVTSIKNAFILPENSCDDCIHLGSIYVENVQELGEIYVITINLQKAMWQYAYREKSQYRSDLEQKIDLHDNEGSSVIT